MLQTEVRGKQFNEKKISIDQYQNGKDKIKS